MEDLHFALGLDRDFSPLDGLDEERSPPRAISPAPAYRVASLLDGLSPHAAVFGCPAGCTSAS